MASHGNFSIPWNVEAYLSDPDVAVMSCAERGLYTTLIFQAWLSDDCGLPFSTKKLKLLARATDKEWDECWPEIKHKFYKEEGRLYNKRLLEEFNKLQVRRNNGAKGGRGNTKANAKLNTKLNESKTRHPEPEPEIELDIKLNTTSRGETSKVSDINWQNAGLDNVYNILKKYLPENDYKRSGNCFIWCLNNFNAFECIDIMNGFRNRMDPELRKAKGFSKPNSAGAYLRWEFQELAKKHNVKIPTDTEADKLAQEKAQ